MVSRREFMLGEVPVAALGLAMAFRPAASPSSAKEGETMNAAYYELQTYRLQSGAQVGRLLGWLEKRALPLLQKSGLGPVGIFTVDVGPHIPAVLVLIPYPSLSEPDTAKFRLGNEAGWDAALAELEVGGEPFYRLDTALLRATPFSPPLKGGEVGAPIHKIFEMRIYESPTQKQLGYLHDRFAGGEIDEFHKSGIHPLLYADTLIGPNQPNMVYLIPFEGLDQREKAWAAFRASPEWVKLRDESVRRGGEIVRNITNMLLAPATFSMIR
jgi:hypothetical protein